MGFNILFSTCSFVYCRSCVCSVIKFSSARYLRLNQSSGVCLYRSYQYIDKYYIYNIMLNNISTLFFIYSHIENIIGTYHTQFSNAFSWRRSTGNMKKHNNNLKSGKTHNRRLLERTRRDKERDVKRKIEKNHRKNFRFRKSLPSALFFVGKRHPAGMLLKFLSLNFFLSLFFFSVVSLKFPPGFP